MHNAPVNHRLHIQDFDFFANDGSGVTPSAEVHKSQREIIVRRR
jgi:hypothetical protein